MNHLFPFFLLVCSLAGLTRTRAQQPALLPLPYADDEPARNWVVKFAPLGLFDPDNTIQFGVERLLGQRNSVQIEAGYGFQGMNLWQQSQNYRYTQKEVWRSRAEWRHYFRRANAPVGGYVAVEGFYKQVNVRENGTVGVGCASGQCQYYQLFRAPLQKYIWGSHVKFGGQLAISQDNRWLLDLYMGLGFRNRQIDRFTPPSNESSYYGGSYSLFDSFRDIPYSLFSMTAGFKVGYAL